MARLHPAAWMGFCLNVAAAVLVALVYAPGLEFGQWLLIAMLAGLVAHGAGLLLLLKGEVKGGMIGGIGSAIFVPLGLIGAYGCAKTAEGIRLQMGVRELDRYQPSPAGSETVKTTAEGAHSRDAGQEGAEDSPKPEPGAVLDQVPDEKFHFADHSAWYAALVGLVLAAMLFMLSGGYDPASLTTPLVICLVIFFFGRRARKLKVLAFYSDHLTCTPGQYKSAIAIPYSAISRAEIKRGKALMHLEGVGGSETVTVNFGLIAGKERERAEAVFLDVMERLGKIESE